MPSDEGIDMRYAFSKSSQDDPEVHIYSEGASTASLCMTSLPNFEVGLKWKFDEITFHYYDKNREAWIDHSRQPNLPPILISELPSPVAERLATQYEDLRSKQNLPPRELTSFRFLKWSTTYKTRSSDADYCYILHGAREKAILQVISRPSLENDRRKDAGAEDQTVPTVVCSADAPQPEEKQGPASETEDTADVAGSVDD